jgi:DNA-binding response OmpR family regulator
VNGKEAKSRARVLVVGDNYALADSLRMVLETEGYVVLTLPGSDTKALAALEHERYDVTVLDVLIGGGMRR